MNDFRVAMIGCGMPSSEEGATGHAMAQSHLRGYKNTDGVVIAAAADLKQTNLDFYAKQFDIPATYTDYKKMLAKENLDIVSISTWPALHTEMVVACAKAGVKAIHCEKPMATTWGDARKMVEVCDRHGVQLTFNHQRRFETPYMTAKKLVEQGAIGDLVRMEAYCGNLYDWGTHWFDMLFFYNHDVPAKWVLGQIDSRTDESIFGARLDDMGISSIGYANGVRGILFSGANHGIGADHRLLGTEGYLELSNPEIRLRGKGDKEMQIITPEEQKSDSIGLAVLDLVSCLRTGREPELSARKAAQATELIFATYESSRWRGRIDLPLQIDDNPFWEMLDAGLMGPNRKA
jgi:UDP-N-acetylglucosamine 3-dehydrogenase